MLRGLLALACWSPLVSFRVTVARKPNESNVRGKSSFGSRLQCTVSPLHSSAPGCGRTPWRGRGGGRLLRTGSRESASHQGQNTHLQGTTQGPTSSHTAPAHGPACPGINPRERLRLSRRITSPLGLPAFCTQELWGTSCLNHSTLIPCHPMWCLCGSKAPAVGYQTQLFWQVWGPGWQGWPCSVRGRAGLRGEVPSTEGAWEGALVRRWSHTSC